jgi:hypothetical protein
LRLTIYFRSIAIVSSLLLLAQTQIIFQMLHFRLAKESPADIQRRGETVSIVRKLAVILSSLHLKSNLNSIMKKDSKSQLEMSTCDWERLEHELFASNPPTRESTPVFDASSSQNDTPVTMGVSFRQPSH